MSEFSSYYLYQEFERRGEQEAIPVYPNVYSIDADGTRERVVKLENDPQCGYEPQAIYRWTNIPITQDYVCDDCPDLQYRWVKTDETTCIKEGPDPQYRWVNIDASVDYYCEGTTKHYKQKKQVSFDGGQTWSDVVPAEYQKGGVAETESTDCGYVPPTFDGKWKATYQDSSVTSAECDSSSAITNGEVAKENLVSVEIGNCVTSIGYVAFSSCSGLTSVSIGSGVTTIEDFVFQGCSGLTSVNLPNSVTHIGSGAFSRCSGLQSITCLATTPPSLGGGAFLSTNNCPIYVPAASVNAYKIATNWSAYGFRIQPIP